ncbi:MAG TPA: carboxypeptidase-like regulatory domain-containing protein [Tepidisphaeraceae bacterium]|jgi:hypothetical protein
MRSSPRPWRWLAAIVAFVLLYFVTPSPALIMVGKGNTPVTDAGWPLGAVDVANLKTRVGWYEGPPFGGGEWTFLYRGDAAALNEALKALGAVRAPAVQVVLHDGPANCQFLTDDKDPKSDTHYDWSFTVWVPESWHRLYNDPRSTFAADQPNFRNPVAPPRMDVYLTPKIDWKQAKVPDGVQVIDQRVPVPAAGAGQKAKGGAMLRGDVFDMANGKPIDGAQVRVERLQRPQNTYEKVVAGTSDKLGRFEVAGIADGQYRLVAAAPGYAPRMLGYEELKDGSSRKLTIELCKIVTFSGTMTDSQGKPVAGVNIRASNTMGIDGRGYPLPDAAETKTDAQGHFALPNVPAGYLQIWGYTPGWFQVEGLKLHAVPQPRPVELKVVATGTIRGKVIGKAGKPAGGGNINVAPPGDPIGKWGGSANVGADGTFEFKEVPPGPYTVSTRPQFPEDPKDPNAVQIEVVSGKVAEVTVKK